MTTFDGRAAFAQLRSLMNREALTQSAQRELHLLIHQCAQHAPQEYSGHWLEYMRGFAHHWSRSALTLSCTEELIAVHELLPFALFSLNLQHQRHAHDLAALCDAPALKSVRWLFISQQAITDDNLIALLEAEHLVSLHDLQCHTNQLTDDGLIALSESPKVDALQTLNLRANAIQDKGAIALAGSPHLTHLKHLHLGSNHITGLGARALATSKTLGAALPSPTSRTVLYLDGNELEAPDIEQLISSRLVTLRGNLHTSFLMDGWDD